MNNFILVALILALMLGYSQGIQITNIESWSVSHKINIALVVVLLYIAYSSNNEHFQTINDDDQIDNYATSPYVNDEDAIDAYNNSTHTAPIISSYNKIDGNSGKYNGSETWVPDASDDTLKTNLFNYKKSELQIMSNPAETFKTYLYKESDIAAGSITLRKKNTTPSEIETVCEFPSDTLIKIEFDDHSENVTVKYLTTDNEFDDIANYVEPVVVAPTYTGSCALDDREEVAEGGYLSGGGYCTNACNCESGECVNNSCSDPIGVSDDSLDSSQYCVDSDGNSIMGNSGISPMVPLRGSCTNPCDCRSGLCRDGICIRDAITDARDNA